jgi:hypothetical protein
VPSTRAISEAIRRAHRAPPVRMPTSTTSPAPRLRSTISWATRVVARLRSAGSITRALSEVTTNRP